MQDRMEQCSRWKNGRVYKLKELNKFLHELEKSDVDDRILCGGPINWFVLRVEYNAKATK